MSIETMRVMNFCLFLLLKLKMLTKQINAEAIAQSISGVELSNCVVLLPTFWYKPLAIT